MLAAVAKLAARLATARREAPPHAWKIEAKLDRVERELDRCRRERPALGGWGQGGHRTAPRRRALP